MADNEDVTPGDQPGEGDAAPIEQQDQFIDKAKRLGWTPKDEFKGDPDRWVDAETFVKRGDEVLPILKANNRKLEKALDNLRAENAEMKATFKEFSEHHTKTVQAQYKNAMRDLEARQAQAAEVGDVEGVKEITREITDLTKEMETKPPAPKADNQPAVDPAFQEAFDEWHEDNAWFQKDRPMTLFALDLDAELAEKGMSPAKRFAEITKQVKAEFPHKFENQRRNQPAAVEAAGSPAGRKAGKGWADLPPEAKAQADRFIRQGLIKDRDAYVKDYQFG